MAWTLDLTQSPRAELCGAESCADSAEVAAKDRRGRSGDLALRLVLIVGLEELLVLLLDLPGVLAGRAEQQLLEMVEQVLAGLLGDLAVGNPGLQVADERCRRGSGRGQHAGVCGRFLVACRW